MEGKRTIWESNCPETLLCLTARTCLVNLDAIVHSAKEDESWKLPAEMGEKLFQVAHEEGLDLDDTFVRLFEHLATISRVSARDSSITDRGIKTLLKHQLRELDIHNCLGLTAYTLNHINRYNGQLLSLCIGDSIQILPDSLQAEGTFLNPEFDGNVYQKQGFIIKAPKLRRLCIQKLFINRGQLYFDLLLRPLPDLTHLDLSGAFHNQGMDSFRWLNCVSNLVSLTLHNVQDVESSLDALTQLTKLIHLDLSQCHEPRGHFQEPDLFLQRLAIGLPKLRSLDISGTNLAGTGEERRTVIDHQCSIVALASRINDPLDFLGLYKTHHDASSRSNIPAVKISGDSCEAQILEAGQRYLDRPVVLENILNDLFHVFRFETCEDLKLALDILLFAMERHIHEKHIQISSSASLYYVVKSERLRKDWNVKVKRKIVRTLLNGMLAHKEDPTMMRNGCLTLCQFQIPGDVLFDYERLVKILLHIVPEHINEENNNFVQRVGIFLLNSLACQVDGEQKVLVGSLGAVETMLRIITEKFQQGVCDEVMETAWSTMWNVTDETSVNCERFLTGGGMYLFLKCKNRFPEKADLLRNMMGLLGNVAEVPSLRHKLMTKEFVEEFAFLLDSCSDEVSYNAAGVLAHMASDGPEAWTIKFPERLEMLMPYILELMNNYRDHVLSRLVRAVNRWDLHSGRNINYRSFLPIIHLAGVAHTPECQLWAVWALANLTTVTPEKYCPLVVQEGGLTLVEDILNENSTKAETAIEKVKSLAEIMRTNVRRWQNQEEILLELEG